MEEPTLTPVQVVSENAQVEITKPTAKELSPNLSLSEVNPEDTTEAMVKTEESQPSKKRKFRLRMF